MNLFIIVIGKFYYLFVIINLSVICFKDVEFLSDNHGEIHVMTLIILVLG